MNSPLKVLITGTNKGIGNQLVKLFLKSNPKAIIYTTSRQKSEIAYERWKVYDKDSRVKCKYLDLSSLQSIAQFVAQMEKEDVKIDILVNNAGVCKNEENSKQLPSVEWAKQCFGINVMGHIVLTEKMLPFLSDNCKIVNISSLLGGLKIQPPQTQSHFQDPKLIKQDYLKAVDEYIEEIKNGKLISFSPNVYATSKMLLNSWSRFVLQRKWLKDKQMSICVTPGLCLTPMTQNFSESILAKAHSAESGAAKIHQTIFSEQLDAQIFYHRARKSDFFLCGQGLPWQ